MSALFEKLIEFITTYFWRLMPFVIMGDDQVGLVRRVGVYKRNMRPGWNWKFPIVEEAMQVNAALDSSMLEEQTLTTLDGVSVTVRGIITWRVVDPQPYILGCDNAQSVINDVGCGVLAELVPAMNAAAVLRAETFPEEFRRRVRKRAKDWGVLIKYAGLADRVQARTYRLITNGNRAPQ